jgi:hypothetical protein
LAAPVNFAVATPCIYLIPTVQFSCVS